MSVGYQHLKKSKIRYKTCSVSWREKWALDADSSKVCVAVRVVFVVSFMAEVSFAERPIIIYHRGGEGERGFCGWSHGFHWEQKGNQSSLTKFEGGTMTNWLLQRMKSFDPLSRRWIITSPLCIVAFLFKCFGNLRKSKEARGKVWEAASSCPMFQLFGRDAVVQQALNGRW